MVISVDILNCTVRKTLIDQGSLADILYWNTFKQLGIPEEELREYQELLVGFSGEQVETRGCINLYTSFGSDMRESVSRPSLNKLKAIVSTPQFAMKFSSERGRIVTIHTDQKTARECYFASLCLKPIQDCRRDVNIVSPRFGKALEIELDPRVDEGCRVEPNENKQPFQLRPKPEQKGAKPIAQKKRKIDGDRAKAVKEETGKLLQAGFIREVRYSTWLANVVMVKKANGKWRMCTYFTDLNKACPKDAYPLPNIDTLVDGAASHRILSFLDAYFGYNQI
ncbi:uncharacterized protein LOC113850777 [Abrus precatorius]|uniref:Uncharacterized protein LOC113850777 n=1 Tax=Abrus precatorius TaxID=3816 RepID=A0A8B8K0F4_ABRPR|nr:uncharacterized protein LOC113850777 [Abrus precatorius]